MLVVSRKQHEKVLLKLASGEVITIVLVDVCRGKVRLGIAASKDVTIYREEIAPEGVVNMAKTVIAKPTSNRD